jgi:hypothetical protein
MKKSILILSVLFLSHSIWAQVVEVEKTLRDQQKDTIYGWTNGGMISLNFSQTSLTNWASGGQNSFAGNGLVSLFAGYKEQKMAWDNSLDIGYGMLRQGKDDLRKTDDKIDLFSKYGREAFGSWFIAGMASFKTQMTPGYNYPNDTLIISDLFAPAYALVAVGMDYKPTKDLNLFLAPLTGKFTFVSNQALADAGAFGVDPAVYDNLGNLITAGKKNRSEIGGYLRFFYKTDLLENVTLQNKLDLFSNYINNPQNIDINWEVMLSMKINKYITFTIATHLIYDDDITVEIDKNGDGIIDEKGPRTQFKEVMAIGFSYKFKNAPEPKKD